MCTKVIRGIKPEFLRDSKFESTDHGIPPAGARPNFRPLRQMHFEVSTNGCVKSKKAKHIGLIRGVCVEFVPVHIPSFWPEGLSQAGSQYQAVPWPDSDTFRHCRHWDWDMRYCVCFLNRSYMCNMINMIDMQVSHKQGHCANSSGSGNLPSAQKMAWITQGLLCTLEQNDSNQKQKRVLRQHISFMMFHVFHLQLRFTFTPCLGDPLGQGERWHDQVESSSNNPTSGKFMQICTCFLCTRNSRQIKHLCVEEFCRRR